MKVKTLIIIINLIITFPDTFYKRLEINAFYHLRVMHNALLPADTNSYLLIII